MSRRIHIYDTTLRDGTQGEGIAFSVDDKLKICERLDEFGFDFIEGGYPASNPKDAEFFQRLSEIRLTRAKITAFGMTRRANVSVEEDHTMRVLSSSGVDVATIVGKSWDFHVTNAIMTTLEENLNMIEESVAYLRSRGMDVIYDAEHFFDGYAANPEYALKTIRAAARAGASAVVLCDTNGGRLPHEIREGVRRVVEEVDCVVGLHPHNDCGLAVANALAAVEAGATHIQGTINGYGERNGNCDLIQVVANLQLKMGLTCVPQENLKKLTSLSKFVSELANVSPDPRQPFVGESVFAHKGGLHVSALLRHPETYEHIDPEKVGNKRRVLVSELSGVSNILYKAQEYDVQLTKDSPALKRVIDVVKNLEHEGYQFEGAEGSFELILKKELGLYRPFFELIGLRLMTDKRDPSDDPLAEATLKVCIGDQTFHTAADGNGPVNALDGALRKALRQVYPEVDSIQLQDYKVRVLNGRTGTASKVRVLITSSENGTTWRTIGVSTNIIEASWRALVDSIEYGLMHRNVEPPELDQAVRQLG